MDPDNGYPVSGSQYGLEQSALGESQWPLYQPQYGQQNEQFTSSQNVPLSPVAPQTYQPYSDPQILYSGYGVPQDSLYPASFSSSNYAPSYQQSNLLHQYAAVQHSAIPSQNHPAQAPQSFQNNNQPYPYTQAFRADDRTISPHVLERVESMPQLQRSVQQWNHGPLTGYENQNVINAIGAHAQQPSSLPSGSEFGPITVGSIVDSGRPALASAQGRDISRTAAPRRGTTSLSQSTLRITNSELLATTQNNTSRRLTCAPFLVIDETPVELASGAKPKPVVSKPVKDTTKRPIDNNLESSAILVTPSTSVTKNRARVSKSGLSTVPANSAVKQEDQKDSKSLISIREKSPASVSASGDESASDDEPSSDEQSAETDMLQEISDIRGETRPEDVVEAAAWDAIGTVFAPKHRGATAGDIIKGTQEFGKFFLNLRDELVSISTELANAEAEKRPEDVKRLKDARELKRKVIASAVQATIKFGKGDILNNFGKNPRLINGLINVLRDCVKFKDLDGDLPRAVLNLLSRCGFITDELLQKAKFEPLEKRFLMNNDAEIKGFIKSIRANTIDAKERAKIAAEAVKAEDIKERLAASEAPRPRKVEEAVAKTAPNLSTLKRALDADASSGKPNKRVASESTGVGSNQKPTVAKPRAPSFFDNLKRPGLKTQAPSKVTSTPAPLKKPESKPEPASTPQSSLAEILASIEKPREVPKTPAAPPRPPETPEEKARRERKESRRHLRVHWKDGNALAEIRLFTHEQAEDEGRQDNMLRDAHDDRSEGMMLKQRVLDSMTDDEDDGSGEIDFRPYLELTLIDFSGLNREDREKTYASRSGTLPINTLQQQIQDRRESMELMVVYTDPKDIPANPKEPPQTTYESPPVERTFGQPSAIWLVQRLHEIYQYGPVNAMAIFARRLESQKGRNNSDAERATKEKPDITSILNAMRVLSSQDGKSAPNQTVHNQHSANQQPNPQNLTTSHNQQNLLQQPAQSFTSTPIRSEQEQKMSNDLLASLTRLTGHLKGKPYPATEPPEWMTERGKAEWWEGYHRDNPTTSQTRSVDVQIPSQHAQQRDTQAHIPAVHMQPQTSQMHYPQIGSYPAPPLPNAVPGATSSYDIGQLQQVLASLNNPSNKAVPPQLQNIFAGLNVQNNQALPQQIQNWPGAWSGVTAGGDFNQIYASQQPQPSLWDNSFASTTDNNRLVYNESSRSIYDGSNNQDSSTYRGREGGYSGDDRHRSNTAAGEYKGKKKPCKFWQEGKCAKGANCTFLHD